jgi:hypothetical protein
MGNLATDVEFRRISNTVAAGTDDTTDCTIIDMEGYDEVTFLLALGTVVNDAVVTLQVGQYSASTSGSMVVSEATSGAITSDGTTIALSNKMIAVTVTKPMYRYLEAQVVRADQNAEIDGVFAILSKSRTKPTTQGTTCYSASVFQSPAAA